MAKKRSNKSLSTLSAKLRAQYDIIDEYQNKGDERQVTELQKRVSSLEKEIKESIAIAMSMIAVNQELINRVQEKEKTATAKKDTGPVTKDDTSTSILNKMYTFFVQGSERDKRNYEIQKDFAEERALESKRRKTTVKRRYTASKIDPKKPSGNPILELLGFIGKGITGILGFIGGGLFGIISKGLGAIKDVFMKIPGISFLSKILGFAKDIGKDGFKFLFNLISMGWDAISGTFKLIRLTYSAVNLITKTLYGIGEKIGEIVLKVIDKSAGFIFKKIFPFIAEIIEKIPGGKSFKGYLGRVGKRMGMGARFAGSLARGGLLVGGALVLKDLYDDVKNGLIYGQEYQDLKDKQNELDDEIAFKKAVASGDKVEILRTGATRAESTDYLRADDSTQQKMREQANKELPELIKEREDVRNEKESARADYLQNTVVPAFEQSGYHKVEDVTDPKVGPVIAFRKNSDNTSDGPNQIEYAPVDIEKQEALDNSSFLSSDYFKNLSGEMDRLRVAKEVVKKQSGDIKQGVVNKLEDIDPQYESAKQIGKDVVGSDTRELESTLKDAEVASKSIDSTATPTTLPIENSTGSVTPEPTAAPAPVSTATPTVTPPTAAPAPTEQREDDSASVTPDTTRPAMVTPSVTPPTPLPTLSDMSEDVDVGSTQVVNMPSQSNASYTNNEYTGSPSVRNPNPVVYRTAMRNDQAQLQ